MKQLIEILLSLINPAAIVLITIALLMANSFIFKRMKSLSSSSDIIKRTISILCGFTGVIAFILALPIDKDLKGQILSFLGIVVSAGIALSSTTILGNLIAGIMNNAMNRFKLGDLIKVNELQGRVTRKGIFHAEIQLEDSNFITVPNLFMATHPVKLTRKSNTVISTSVSLGYDISRIQIEKLLKEAAHKTGLSDPYLYITDLGDYSVKYKIHGFLNDSGKYFMTGSKLNGMVMDILHQHQIEIASPAIMNQRKTDNYRFIPKNEPLQKIQKEDSNPELLVFDEAIESEKIEERKERIEKLEKKMQEIQGKLKEAKDDAEIKKFEASIAHLEKLISELKKDLEEEK